MSARSVSSWPKLGRTNRGGWHVREEAWVFVDAPAACFVAEGADDGNGLETERAVAVAQRDVHAGIAEADDVRASGSAQVGEETGMLVDPPAGVEAQVGDDEP